MELEFGCWVRVRSTATTHALGIAGLEGEVVGKSREDDSTPVIAYAVLLHRPGRAYMVDADALEQVQ